MFLRSKGYLQARVAKPQQEESEPGVSWLISVTEGRLYHLGQIAIESSKLLSPDQIKEMLDLREGDIIDTERINTWLYKRLMRIYQNAGYLQFTAEVEPVYHVKANSDEGVADLKITVDEGALFIVRSINFDGSGDTSDEALLRQMLIRVGRFAAVTERDVEFKVERDSPFLDLNIHLKRKTP